MCKRLCAILLVLALLLTVAPAALAAPTTPASGAVVLDFQTGEMYYSKNPDVPRPVASMTKIMSLYLIFQAIREEKLTAQTVIPISDYACRVSNDSEYSGGEQFKRQDAVPADDLLKLILTASANASVIALAEYIDGSEEAFVERMNATAAQWGVSAHFADCTGFESEGNAVTPRAMALITQRLLREFPQVLEYSRLPSTKFRGRNFSSTNTLLTEGKVDGIDGLKTGWTRAAGHCFTGTAQRDGQRIISVVLNAGSKANRMNETKKLLEYGFTCRAQREMEWSAAGAALQASFSAPEGVTVVAGGENSLRLTLTGGEIPLPCGYAVEVAGRRVELGTAPLTDPLTLDFTCPAVAAVEAPITAVVTLPGGEEVRRECVLRQTEVSVSGYMGIPYASIYPGVTLTVPCQVQCDQGVARNVPAAWYLDGAPIPHYSNSSFPLSPQGNSKYTFTPDGKTAPGKHTLELRFNPEGLPGIKQSSVTAVLDVLPLP